MPFKAYCNLEQFMQEQLHTRNWFDITCVLLVATKLAGAKKGHFTPWTSLKICQAFFENSITSKDFKQQQACLQISKLWFNFVYLINYVCERQHKTVVVHKKKTMWSLLSMMALMAFQSHDLCSPPTLVGITESFQVQQTQLSYI